MSVSTLLEFPSAAANHYHQQLLLLLLQGCNATLSEGTSNLRLSSILARKVRGQGQVQSFLGFTVRHIRIILRAKGLLCERVFFCYFISYFCFILCISVLF